MTRYRIVRRPGYVDPTEPVYEIERRVLWWWEDTRGVFFSVEEAKEWILHLQAADANPIKREIVYQQP